ncbi:hypothetical protein XENTR_v10001130 [Xenopus tropicalis]|nr:hypothetical protein XENTR_v10001130 [Xenopus tropicalis]
MIVLFDNQFVLCKKLFEYSSSIFHFNFSKYSHFVGRCGLRFPDRDIDGKWYHLFSNLIFVARILKACYFSKSQVLTGNAVAFHQSKYQA